MNFNKKYFHKDNGKKILHKSRGKWVTITASVLLALGIAGVSTVSANADSDVQPSVPKIVDRNGNNISAQTAADETHIQGKNSINNGSRNTLPTVNNNGPKAGNGNSDISKTNLANLQQQQNQAINNNDTEKDASPSQRMKNFYNELNNNENKSINAAKEINKQKINANHINNDPELTNPTFNENYHYNVPAGFFNDVQTITPNYDSSGKVKSYNVYYLWNPMPNDKNAQPADQWYHSITKDFSTFAPYDTSDSTSIKNVAIPDPTYEDSQGRSIYVSDNNSEQIPWHQVAAGTILSNSDLGSNRLTQDQFGNQIDPNAKIAYFSTFNDDYVTTNAENSTHHIPDISGRGQAYDVAPGYSNNTNTDNGIYLAYSNDGKQFHPYGNYPVITASSVGLPDSFPYGSDFRDPFVTKQNGKLIAYVGGCENLKIYALTSNDGVNWNHNPSEDIDLSNTPTIGPARSYGKGNIVETPNVVEFGNKYAMFFSLQLTANKAHDYTCYMIGHLDDNGVFKPDNSNEFHYLDHGFDNYANNFKSIDDNTVVDIGWLGNWGYSPLADSDYKNYHNGNFTLSRVLKLNNGEINVYPIDPGQCSKFATLVMDANSNLDVSSDNELNVKFNQPKSKFNLVFNRLDGSYNYANEHENNIKVSFDNGELTFYRTDGINNNMNSDETVNVGTKNLSSIRFYLDNNSVEMYVPDTHKIWTIADYTFNHNAPYELSSDTPANIDEYTFNTNVSPNVASIANTNNHNNSNNDMYNSIKDFLNGKSLNSNESEIVSNAKNMINSYEPTITSAINNANINSSTAAADNDSRSSVYIALANNAVDDANTKLYQYDVQLNNLKAIARNHGDSSVVYNKAGINGNNYYDANGMELKNAFVTSNNRVDYYDGNGNQNDNQSINVGPDAFSDDIDTGKLTNVGSSLTYTNGKFTYPTFAKYAASTATDDTMPNNQDKSQPNGNPKSTFNNNQNAPQPNGNQIAPQQKHSYVPQPSNNNDVNAPVIPQASTNNYTPTSVIPDLTSNTPNNYQPSESTVVTTPTSSNDNESPETSNNNPTAMPKHHNNKPVMNRRVSQIALKREYRAEMSGKRYVTLPKGYSMRVANTVHQHGRDVYVAKFNRKNVWIPASVAKIIGYAVTNKATSYPRWININDRNTGIRKNSNGRIVKNLRHNTLRVLGLTYNKRGQEFYAVRYNGHRVYITTSPKYVYKTYLQTDRRNFKVYIKHPTLVHVSQRFTAKHHLHVINAGRYVRVRKVVRDNDYRTRFYISAHKYVTGNKYYVKFVK